jgi:hypothetical protein
VTQATTGRRAQDEKQNPKGVMMGMNKRHMDLSPLADMDREGLLEYVQSLLWQYRLVDAFWFINVENRHSLAEAEEINAVVWDKVSELSARDLVERFGPFEKGLAGWRKAWSLFPWSMMVECELEDRGDEIILRVPECPAQAGRRRHGLGEYACKEMHAREFAGFARVIDPAIRVECDFAPPDPHPEDMDCIWRFRVEE